MLEGIIGPKYTQILNDVLARRASVAQHAETFVRTKVPEGLKKYFQPEFAYVRNIGEELDADIDAILGEKGRDPLTLFTLKYDDPADQEHFAARMKRRIEDLTYAAEVATYHAHQIIDTKVNTPIVGWFARRKLQGALGKEELPALEETIGQIQEYKMKALGMGSFILGPSLLEVSTDKQIATRYQMRMPSMLKRRQALEYGKNNNRTSITSSTTIPYERFNTQWSYATSPHNSFFEKVIGGIGAIGDYVVSSISNFLTKPRTLSYRTADT